MLPDDRPGIRLCCPVHEALLIEAPADDIDAAIAATQPAMREGSEVLLESFSLRTDAKVVKHPDRYMNKRGKAIWETVCELCGKEP
ncbi:MAG: hypothetical protein EBV06_02530 [Planctomycetia bacterium]|nr:hypothetical protein [Planctomycetia bacterium]